MTSVDQTCMGPTRPAPRKALASMIKWWFERQRPAHDYRGLAQMPDHILRDIGLKHLINLNRDPEFRHRLL